MVAGYFRRRGVEFPSEYNCPQVPTAEFAAAVSSEMLNKFLDGETDKVELIYTQFVSLIASAPKLKTLLPLSKTGLEAAEDEMFELTTEDGELAVETTPLDAPEAKEFPKDTIFEQDPIAILNGILPLYLDGQILRSLQEAVASELASRMQSMQSASDNAKDLKKSLSQTYNRIRQAGVTQEILEIVAGASASEYTLLRWQRVVDCSLFDYCRAGIGTSPDAPPKYEDLETVPYDEPPQYDESTMKSEPTTCDT